MKHRGLVKHMARVCRFDDLSAHPAIDFVWKRTSLQDRNLDYWRNRASEKPIWQLSSA
jgi:hypothetical protein